MNTNDDLSKEFHISRNGEVLEKCSEEVMTQKLKSGQLLITDYFWTKGMSDWLPLSEFKPSKSPRRKTTNTLQKIDLRKIIPLKIFSEINYFDILYIFIVTLGLYNKSFFFPYPLLFTAIFIFSKSGGIEFFNQGTIGGKVFFVTSLIVFSYCIIAPRYISEPARFFINIKIFFLIWAFHRFAWFAYKNKNYLKDRYLLHMGDILFMTSIALVCLFTIYEFMAREGIITHIYLPY
jgi:GYF domain 2